MPAILSAQAWLNWAPFVELAATLILIASLLRNRLHIVYRFFFAYLAADAAETAAAIIFQKIRRLYAEIYFGGQTVKMFLAVLVVLEIYRLALAGQPALARFGKTAVIYVLGAAAAIAGAGFGLDRGAPPGARAPILHQFASFERTMDAWMLLFLLIIGVFVLWFPVRVTRNGALYISGFVIYFLTRSVGLLLSNVSPELVMKFDTSMIAVQILCLIVWIAALRPEGETAITVTGHRWDPDAADRLKDQLNTINATLLRLSRRLN
ncbi:MAG TPA: hypothetical protein VMG40_02020 [Bryobacteraceae bacterium]|nr:hypothetical protein [Bryobacteraceae bacterium]